MILYVRGATSATTQLTSLALHNWWKLLLSTHENWLYYLSALL